MRPKSKYLWEGECYYTSTGIINQPDTGGLLETLCHTRVQFKLSEDGERAYVSFVDGRVFIKEEDPMGPRETASLFTYSRDIELFVKEDNLRAFTECNSQLPIAEVLRPILERAKPCSCDQCGSIRRAS